MYFFFLVSLRRRVFPHSAQNATHTPTHPPPTHTMNITSLLTTANTSSTARTLLCAGLGNAADAEDRVIVDLGKKNKKKESEREELSRNEQEKDGKKS